MLMRIFADEEFNAQRNGTRLKNLNRLIGLLSPRECRNRTIQKRIKIELFNVLFLFDNAFLLVIYVFLERV